MNPAGFGALAKTVHWATAILVLLAFVFGPGGPESHVYSDALDFQRELHESLGLCVFALTTFRAGWRLVWGRPATPAMPRWMDLAAKVVQGGLYFLLFALPITAIWGAWLEGHPLTLAAGLRIAPAFGEAHSAGAVIAEIHTWLGDAILWIAGLHAAAALFHHVVLRDQVLVSMLPGWVVERLPKSL